MTTKEKVLRELEKEVENHIYPRQSYAVMEREGIKSFCEVSNWSIEKLTSSNIKIIEMIYI